MSAPYLVRADDSVVRREATRWFHPGSILRTAVRVFFSTTIAAYTDRREALAALPRSVPGRAPRGKVLPVARGIDARVDEQSEEVWIDFAADVGDGFDGTFAVASLLGRPHLRLPGLARALPRADILALGGDLVYPTPSRDGYAERLVGPLRAALPGPCREEDAPSAFAIPGNHDWYDGLNSFIRTFCQGSPIGVWRMWQSRSYFAVKLPGPWWLWGVDMQFDHRIDPAQLRYFTDLRRPLEGDDETPRLEPGDQVILVTARPSWLGCERRDEAFRNLAFFERAAITDAGATAALVLAGDLHHYARYQGPEGQQRVTCGGGGAYTLGTHHLPGWVDLPSPAARSGYGEGGREEGGEGKGHRKAGRGSRGDGRGHEAVGPAGVPLRTFLFEERLVPPVVKKEKVSGPASRRSGREESEEQGNGGPGRKHGRRGVPKTRPFQESGFSYPDRPTSRRLVRRILRLPVMAHNRGFCAAVASLYLALVLLVQPPDTAGVGLPGYLRAAAGGVAATPFRATLPVLVILACGVFAVASNRRIAGQGAWVWGGLHGGAHVAAGLALGWLALVWAQPVDGPSPWGVVAGLLGVGAGGFVVGGVLFGLYLLVSDRLWGWHLNDIFAALNIPDYRSFVRMHVQGDRVTLYPIGLERVPRRWRRRIETEVEHDPGVPALLEPADGVPLEPHLIEGPVVIRPSTP